ncbi:MAG: hypothetical protein BYD32DRAFT_463433 [Podila humilis]|nr:MAG: hypothetical protein BYD32DRAFT_463433 [Podila humilis]
MQALQHEQISDVITNNVVVLTSPGIAALILHDGHTAHSVFKVPISVFKDPTCNITRKQQGLTLGSFRLKIVVFGGDFRQVLPVVVRGSQSQIEGACLRCLTPFGLRIPDHIHFTPHEPNLNSDHEIQLICTMYPNISKGNFTPRDIKRTAILPTLNKDVNHMNDLATTLFPGEQQSTMAKTL